ncbi:hypothetical protein RDn1_265 [Candidatus Termititenax dinenymphae]|uniref:Uncharacterized protein n=1 Tax=Candidatus Termititenax dinenymphae TaxID=2218523 RepID=A0A388TKN9_9BACT|nr:hypothetical protein RDn1_265 [Candidatus Termititenax dinenymphae]
MVGSYKAYGAAYGINGLQFSADNAADFQNMDGAQGDAAPLNALISTTLWTKIQGSLKNETRSYYDIMMEGANDLDPESAFAVLTAMLESRTRVSSTMTEIFGSPDQTDAQRVAAFGRWYAESGLASDPVKSGFFQFFMQAEQSFVSHILPMYGQSAGFIESDLDKAKLQTFLINMQNQIAQYTGLTAAQLNNPDNASLLSGDKKAAFLIWQAWLNPEENMPTAEQNVELRSTAWGEEVFEKLQGEMDKIINQNIASRVAYRQRYEKYKKEKEEYEEKIEEEEKIESEQEQSAKKKIAEQKALLEKIAAQNRAAASANNQAKPVQKETKSSAPVQQQTRQAVKTAPAAKAATKVAAAKPVKQAAAPKITTAAKPVKITTAKPADTAAAKKPVLRVRKGATPAKAAQVSAAKMSTKKVLTSYSARTSKGKRTRVNRARSKNVWGKSSVFK